MSPCTIGVDFGTGSCRAVVVRMSDGCEVATAVHTFAQGQDGVIVVPGNPDLARQSVREYEAAVEHVLRQVTDEARQAGVAGDQILAIGVDATGSTPIPVDAQGVALEHDPRFADNPNAMAWLWKDHTAHDEAERITKLARNLRPNYLARCGGKYSSEWFWSKILYCLRVDRPVFEATHSWVEASDYIPAYLSGTRHPSRLKRGVCAAGHKAMFAPDWGGLPDEEFLSELDPALAALRPRLYDRAHPGNAVAGGLDPAVARRVGLRAGIPVTVGLIDAHAGAVGAGVRVGTLVKVIGTSTCDMAVAPAQSPLGDISGLCGVVHGSILPGYWGLEAGQPAVGDIFSSFITQATGAWMSPTGGVMESARAHQILTNRAAELKPGQSGLLALDWHNGNRSVLMDSRLSGLIVGLTLRTEAHEVYRALIEATAFGARMILDRMAVSGVMVDQVVNCGGIAERNDLLMQIYADVMNRPMRLSASAQTPALGSAVMAAACGSPAEGFHASVEAAQTAMCRIKERVFIPRPDHVKTYNELFDLYRVLHDQFGAIQGAADLGGVMRRLRVLAAG